MELDNQRLPKARKENILIQELPDETLVYDLRSHKAHCLNETAALVWNNCDGQTTVSEMTSILEEKMKVQVDQDIVWFSLEQLEKAKLLVEKVTRKSDLVLLARRNVIKKIGIGAAIAAPLVMSLIVPEAAHAASCGRKNDPCSATMPCCSGCTCQDSKCKC